MGLFLVLNLPASLFCCVLLFSNDIFLLQPHLLMPYLLLMWKRPNSCLILAHWELNFGVIVTLLCLSLVLAVPEQHQVYSRHRVQLAALWMLTFMIIIQNLGSGAENNSLLVISVFVRAGIADTFILQVRLSWQKVREAKGRTLPKAEHVRSRENWRRIWKGNMQRTHSVLSSILSAQGRVAAGRSGIHDTKGCWAVRLK